MVKEFSDLLEKFDETLQEQFYALHQMIIEASANQAVEKLWAKLPSYYVGDKFVRLIPFKDHINFEAAAIQTHCLELNGYNITPKGMLQLYVNQPIPEEAIKMVIKESL